MATLFITIVFLAMAHFVYEGILAPSIRLRLRYRIFEQRDRLRELKIVRDDVSPEIFHAIHDSINTAVELIHAINFSVVCQLDSVLKKNPGLREQIDRRKELLDRCCVDEIKSIRSRTSTIIGEALIANTLGTVIWMIPVVIGFICFDWLRRQTQLMLLMPPKKMEITMGFADSTAAC